MKLTKVKKYVSLSKVWFILGFLFWLIETVYFHISFGLHWHAINQSERLCDIISGLMFDVAFVSIFIAIFNFFDYIFNDDFIKS